ncbi:MAG: hypothetical protein WB681_03130 [Candidatus Cybelea sp.]
MKRNTQSTGGKPSVSETLEKFSFGTGHVYADNLEFASKGLRFDILEIKFEPGRGYEGHDRWLVTVKVADREPEQLSLGSNPGRDQQLRDAQAHLARGGKIENVRLRQSGKAYYFTESDG